MLVFCWLPCAHSLADNALCGIKYGEGTYTAEGITSIAEMLKVNSTLQTLEYAANRLSPLSAAADSGESSLLAFSHLPCSPLHVFLGPT